jgi:hypothetical protein
MSKTETEAEARERSAKLVDLCAAMGTLEIAADLIRARCSLEDAAHRIRDHIARKSGLGSKTLN